MHNANEKRFYAQTCDSIAPLKCGRRRIAHTHKQPHGHNENDFHVTVAQRMANEFTSSEFISLVLRLSDSACVAFTKLQ